jgi:pilus assembly protein CpaC
LLTFFFALSFSPVAQEKAILQASFSNTGQSVKIDVLVGQSRVIEFDEEYERLSISDDKIAQVVPITSRQALINGLTFGQVNLVAWAKRPKGTPERMLVFDLYVQVNLSLIDNQIKILYPKENIQLSQANNSVVISGSVTKPEMAEQVQKIIEAAGLKVTNLLKAPVLDAAQVQLQIRVAEVNRQVLRELSMAYGIGNRSVPAYISPGGPSLVTQNTGIDLISTALTAATLASSGVNILLGSSTASFMAFITALNQRGAIRGLAEPNLIAMHGQKASFLAGGEFPIPIVQSLNSGQTAVTIFFKEFGVKLNFTPTIIDENHIRLELEPEVSTPDYSYGIVLQGYSVPGLTTRRAKTSLELRDGQSFALAGLIDNREQVNLSKVPLLGDVPIVGELFKSRRFQRNESELMFLATVKIVEPLNPDQLPRLPGVSELKPVGSTDPSGAAPASTIEGQSGHSTTPATTPAAAPATTQPSPPPRKTEQNGAESKAPGAQSSQEKAEKPAGTNLTSSVIGPSGADLGPPKAPPSPAKPEAKPEKP